jgi:hypothetical protein
MQAGHFVPGRTLSLLFHPFNCHVQCYGCNVGRNGAHVEYFIYMENRYGREMIDDLRYLKNQTRKYSIADYEELIDDLTKKLEAM